MSISPRKLSLKPRRRRLAQEVGRGHLLRSLVAPLGHALGGGEGRERLDGGMKDVYGVSAARRLRQDVSDSGALHDRTHRSSCDDTRTRGRRLQQDHAARVPTDDLVGDGRADHGHFEEVALRLLDALLYRRGYLSGLSVPDPDLPGAVANDHERGEREPAAPLDDLGHAIDRHYALFVLRPVVVSAATPSATTTCTSHAAPLLSSELKAAVAGAIGKGLDPAVKPEPAAIKGDCRHPGILRPRGDRSSDRLGPSLGIPLAR